MSTQKKFPLSKGVMALLALAVVVIGLSAIAFSSGSKEARPEVGYTAPDFTLSDLDGNPVKLSDFRGQVVYLNFWATWCPPCREEMPAIEAIHKEMGDKVKVLAVNIEGTRDEVSAFAREFGLSFPIVLDSDLSVARKYLVRGIPVSLFIDKDGVIRAKYVGGLTKDKMAQAIRKASGG